MKKFMIVLKKDIFEQIRTKKFLIIFLVMILFGLASPLLAYFMPDIIKQIDLQIDIKIPDATIIDSYLQFIKNIAQTLTFVLIIIFSIAIVNEKKKGTYHVLLSNGVKTKTFILSKVVSQTLVILISYFATIGLFGFYNYVFFDTWFVNHSVIFFLLIFVNLLFILSISLVANTISKNSTFAIALTFIFFFIFSIINIIPKINVYLPMYLLDLSSKVINNSFEFLEIIYCLIATLILIIINIMISIYICKKIEK